MNELFGDGSFFHPHLVDLLFSSKKTIHNLFTEMEDDVDSDQDDFDSGSSGTPTPIPSGPNSRAASPAPGDGRGWLFSKRAPKSAARYQPLDQSSA